MQFDHPLTELEGAILTEIALRANDTAYKVRRAFQTSPSVQWRGSAGAVSPAIRRLQAAGLIDSVPHPRRAGQLLSLTPEGQGALDAWAMNCEAAVGVGFDPFRLRAAVWDYLPLARRRALWIDLKQALLAQRSLLEVRAVADKSDGRQTELAIALLDGRLAWLDRRTGVSDAANR